MLISEIPVYAVSDSTEGKVLECIGNISGRYYYMDEDSFDVIEKLVYEKR